MTDSVPGPPASVAAIQPAPSSSQRRPFRNYVDSILDVLARDPDRDIITFSDGRFDHRLSASAFRDRVLRVTAEFADRGIGPGSTVGILAGNRPEVLSARYAANLLGARVAFLHEVIHQQMAPEVVARIVTSVDTGLLLIDNALDGLAEHLVSRRRFPPILFLGPSPLGEDLAACSVRHAVRRVASAARSEDGWCIRLTGGSTDVPKNVCMTFAQYQGALADRMALLNSRPLPPAAARPCFLVCASIGHSAGTTTDATLLAGGNVVLQRWFDPGKVLSAIARERVTDVWMLSPMLGRLLDHPSAGTTDLSSLRRVSYGGHLLSPARLPRAHELFGPILHGWYGQAEAGLICEVKPEEHALIGENGQITAGRPVPGVELAICDPAGERLPAGVLGEVLVRSPQVMSGYWKRPELTAEVLHDGWLRTGDAGYVDEAGYLYLAGRLKEMIKLAGFPMLFPPELEGFLLTHPAIEQCMVFAVRGADDAEELHAAVVAAPAHLIDHEEIRGFVTSHRGAIFVPHVLHVLDDIPLNAVGKPDKKKVLARLGLTQASVGIY